MDATTLRRSLLDADPLLSKYDPLDRILLADNFDTGMHGWTPLFPDYDGVDDYPGRYPHVEPLSGSLKLAAGNPEMRIDRRIPVGKHGVPMLSSITSWDVGTSGAWDGTYALKVPTTARAGDRGTAIKRLSSPWRGKFRVETWFTYKADPSDYRLGETDVRAFLVAFDVMDWHHIKREGLNPLRWWPAFRYVNADEDGRLIGRWQANFGGSVGVVDGPFEDLPDGRQELGFNRSPTKYQWHYLRLTFDLARHEYVDFHCAGQEFDVAGRKHIQDPPLVGWRSSTDKCPGLVGCQFVIQTNSDKRCFLYLDSVVVSATAE